MPAADPPTLFLDAGTEEGDLLNDTRTFHHVLVTAGHDVTYREFRGGHDHACWRGSLADGIVDVLSKPSSRAGAEGEPGARKQRRSYRSTGHSFDARVETDGRAGASRRLALLTSHAAANERRVVDPKDRWAYRKARQ